MLTVIARKITHANTIITILVGCWLIAWLSGCSCETYCKLFLASASLKNKTTSSGDELRQRNSACQDICKLGYLPSYSPQKNSSTNQPTGDSIQSTGNPIPEKKEPGQIDNKTEIKQKKLLPGEYFSTAITGGTTASFWSGPEIYGPHTTPPRTGIHFGLGTAMPLPGGNWGLSTTIRFKQLNGIQKLDYSDPGGVYSSEINTAYNYNLVSGNLMARYHVGKNLSLTAGPELNYLVSASSKESSSDRQDIKKSSNNLGIDMLAGVKYELKGKSRRPKWGISLIYDHGLSRLNKKHANGFIMPAQKMKSVQLGISYFICNSCNK